MKNYITVEQAKQNGLTLTEYNFKTINEKLRELEAFKTVVKLVPLCITNGNDGSIQYVDVYIEYKGVLLRPYKGYGDKSFEFFLAEDTHVVGFQNDLQKPRKVGQPTEKKLDEWLVYLQAVEELKIAKKNERQTRETEFLDKIKNSGLDVHFQSPDNKRGWITTTNFEFYFEIQSSGYIEQRINLRCGNTINDFLKLASYETKNN